MTRTLRDLAAAIPARPLLRAAAAGGAFMTLVAMGGTAAAANGVFVPASVTSQTSATGTNSPAPEPEPSTSTEPSSDPEPSSGPATTEAPKPPATPPTPITEIDVDVEIDDNSDHSIRTANTYEFSIEGDRYGSTFVYRNRDGKTYRGRDLDCSDFDTQADAQAVLDAAGSDVYWLDGDGDGRACERESGEFTRDTYETVGLRRGGQVETWPVGSVATGIA